MSNFLNIKYNVLLIIFISWIFLIIPFLVSYKKNKYQLISQVVGNKNLGRVVTSGVISTSLLQLLFATYILIDHGVGLFSIIGVILYIIGILAFGISGFLNIYKYEKIHNLLIRIYYLLMSLGFIFVSAENYFFSNELKWLLELAIAIFLLTIPILIYIKKNVILSELVIISLSNIWALVIVYIL
ncbi:hypothetical protein A2Z22_02535 [Candidatus Woesebacteria bacterium RBG_16_34_12]|uniref:DUF998 domain-containing protein n=1 Tax=Candidatus Woesebacteria bacterium RBG_16_34_12 TaxID=1802480 RepID=A0A1F7XBF0_9BACT|nr:MAG: hypothetical protein A2Z22_02535 [Candidatus Woesebacteria bacterium RBG_16_34_12]